MLSVIATASLGFTLWTEKQRTFSQSEPDYVNTEDEQRLEGVDELNKPEIADESIEEFKLIKPSSLGNIMIFAGTGNKELASEVATHLKVRPGRLTIGRTPDGEISVEINENVRGRNVFVIQPVCKPVNDNLMELLLLVSTLKRASCNKITAIIPYYGYGRHYTRALEDRDIPLAAADVADMLCQMGVDNIITVDLHITDIRGFFPSNVSVTNLDVSPVGVRYFKEKIENKQMRNKIVIISTDLNGIRRAIRFKNMLTTLGIQAGVAFIADRREKTTYTYRAGEGDKDFYKEGELVGDSVDGKDCIIVDDMIDTGKRALRTAECLKNAGAKGIYMYATHGLFGPEFQSKIEKSPLSEVVVTNTVPMGFTTSKIEQLSVGIFLAEAIRRVHMKKSTGILESS